MCNVQDTESYPNVKVPGAPVPRYGPDQGLLATLTSPTGLLNILSSCPFLPHWWDKTQLGKYNTCSCSPGTSPCLAAVPSSQILTLASCLFWFGPRLLISVPCSDPEANPPQPRSQALAWDISCAGSRAMAEMHRELGLKFLTRDFPGGPVVKTSPSNAGGAGSIRGWGAKIPHASGPKNQNIKQKQYCNKFNKDF